MASMKKSQLREYIRNYINEIRLKSGDKSGGLKVYKIGIKHVLYILQTNGHLIFTVGFPISGNAIRFDEESEINKIKKILTANNIPFETSTVPGSAGWSNPSGTKYIDVDKDNLNIIEKPVNTTVNQVDPKGDGWYYDMNINEIRLKSGKRGVLNAFRGSVGSKKKMVIYFNQDGVYEMITAEFLLPRKYYVRIVLQSGTEYVDLINILEFNNIPFEKDVLSTPGNYKLMISSDYINFIDVPMLSNIPNDQIENHSNEYGLNEIRFKSGGKGGAASIDTLNIGDVFSINNDVAVAGSISTYKLSAKKYKDYRFLVVKVNPKRVVAVLISPDNKKVISYQDIVNGVVKFPTSVINNLHLGRPGYETALKTVEDYGLEISDEDKDLNVVTFSKTDDVESIRLSEVRLKSGDSSKVVTPQSLIGKKALNYNDDKGKIIDAAYASNWKRLTKYDNSGWMDSSTIGELDTNTILVAFELAENKHMGAVDGPYSGGTDVYVFGYEGVVLAEVRFISSKVDKLKAFKDRDGGVSIYYNEPGADWFSQVVESDYGRINPRTGLVDFYFWSDEKMNDFENMLNHNNIKYNKDTSDEDSDLISIEQSRFDFIEKTLGPNLKDVGDNEWYNDRNK